VYPFFLDYYNESLQVSDLKKKVGYCLLQTLSKKWSLAVRGGERGAPATNLGELGQI